MKRPHLLRVESGAPDYSELFAAASGAGLRVGWLDLAGEPRPPADLEAAAGLGAMRAVAAKGERTVAVKPLRGAPVLEDLLREHFRGCRLVLVRGGSTAPLLTVVAGGWKIGQAGGGELELSTGELVRRLRSPKPLGGQPSNPA